MLRFLGVFGDIAVSANEEETHCAALRRQRSEVRILSGAPLLHLNRPDTFVFRLPTQLAVVQMVVQWRTEGFRTSTPNAVCSIFKNVFQQTSNIDTEERSSVSLCGPKTPSKQTD